MSITVRGLICGMKWRERYVQRFTCFQSRYVQSRIGVTYERTQMSHVRS
jgi:hypothetical protein